MLKSNVMKKVNALAKAICSACGGDYRIALHFAFKYAYSKKGSHNFGLRQAIYRLAGFCGMPYWFAEEKGLFEMMNNFVSYKRAHETEKAVLLDIAYNALVSEGWDYKTKTLHEKVWVPKSIMVA